MENLDWSTFTKRISINTNEESIFNAWNSQDGLEKWFLSKAQFSNSDNVEKDRISNIEKGDKYEWMWHGSDDVAEGVVLENNGKDFIAFTFLGCKVSVKIQRENGENVVELIQSEISLDEQSRLSDYVGCTRGWTFFMTNLKSILEGGIDLRNRNGNLKNVINT